MNILFQFCMATLIKVHILMCRYMSENGHVPGATIVDYVSVNQYNYYLIGTEAYACIGVYTGFQLSTTQKVLTNFGYC